MNRPLIDIGSEPQPVGDTAPQVLARIATTPAGAPWTQARAAQLDAEHGAALPAAELMMQVRRLEPWRLGQPGRFGVFYVRKREYRGPFEATVDLDGREVHVAFGPQAGRQARVRRAAVVFVAMLTAAAAVSAGAGMALQARRAAALRLEVAETLSASRLRAMQAARARASQAQDLARLAGAARPLEDVLGDLTWVAGARAPDARLVGVHWDRGLLAVEVRGEAEPFPATSRSVERAEEPIRPGVWLWGIGAAGQGPRPAAAELRQ